MTEQKFTKLEALEDILKTLKGYDGCIEDLHNAVFNSDDYIIGHYQAEEALKNSEYGIFGAIAKIQEYETANYCEVVTYLGSAKQVANMLYYIISEEVIADIPCFYDYSGVLDEYEKASLMHEIQEMIENEKY